MSKPAYPRSSRSRFALSDLRNVSKTKLAGGALLALIALAPRCGGVSYKAKWVDFEAQRAAATDQCKAEGECERSASPASQRK